MINLSKSPLLKCYESSHFIYLFNSPFPADLVKLVQIVSTYIILFFCFDSHAALNVFNFFSISVSSSRQTHDLCISERGQTFNYTLLKYGSLLNRLRCFCFTKRRSLRENYLYFSLTSTADLIRSLCLIFGTFIYLPYIINCLLKASWKNITITYILMQ